MPPCLRVTEEVGAVHTRTHTHTHTHTHTDTHTCAHTHTHTHTHTGTHTHTHTHTHSHTHTHTHTHTLTLTHTHTHTHTQVFTWGCNDEGALGRTIDEGQEFAPGVVDKLEGVNIVQVAAGDSHTAALSDTGTVYAKGIFRVR